MNKRKANVSGSNQITHYFGTPAAKKPGGTSLTSQQEHKSTEQRDTSDKLSEPPAVEPLLTHLTQIFICQLWEL